jgi:hypothetical protein
MEESNAHLTLLLQLMKAIVLNESSDFIYFHRALSLPAMSTDMSQVCVALFHSFCLVGLGWRCMYVSAFPTCSMRSSSYISIFFFFFIFIFWWIPLDIFCHPSSEHVQTLLTFLFQYNLFLIMWKINIPKFYNQPVLHLPYTHSPAPSMWRKQILSLSTTINVDWSFQLENRHTAPNTNCI